MRVVGVQLLATILVTTGFLLQGRDSGLAALSGGVTVALGTGVLALRMFAPGPAAAGTVLARLIVGNLLKWGVIVIGLYLAMVKAALPAFPVIVGVVVALLPQMLGMHDGWTRRD